MGRLGLGIRDTLRPLTPAATPASLIDNYRQILAYQIDTKCTNGSEIVAPETVKIAGLKRSFR
jgi:hypothetical protein